MSRSNLSRMMTKISVRLILSVVFSLGWYFFSKREVSLNAPMVFCGAVCLASSWFSYLKNDGVSLRLPFSLNRLRAEKAEKSIPGSERLTDFPEDNSAPAANRWAGLLSGTVLIAASFLF